MFTGRLLKITNCDVTYPKKLRDGGNGKDRISAVLKGLASRPLGLEGVLVLWDADDDANIAFAEAVKSFRFDEAPFNPPQTPFTVRTSGKIKTAIYLLPGPDNTGTLEHLLFEAAAENKPEAARCVNQLCECADIDTGNLSANDRAKVRAATMIAICCEEPTCSLGWIWNKKGNPVPIDSGKFEHFSSFVTRFVSGEQITIPV